MPSFAFVALDAQGQQVSDYLDAANQTEAINLLRSRGLFPTSVKEQAAGSKKAGKKARAPDQLPFSLRPLNTRLEEPSGSRP